MTALNITLGETLARETFQNTQILNLDWILGAIIVFLSVLAITRDIEKWKVLAFPMTTLWHIVGIRQSIILFIATAIMFTVEVLSIQMVGNIIMATKNKAVEAIGLRKYGAPWQAIEAGKSRIKTRQLLKGITRPSREVEDILDVAEKLRIKARTRGLKHISRIEDIKDKTKLMESTRATRRKQKTMSIKDRTKVMEDTRGTRILQSLFGTADKIKVGDLTRTQRKSYGLREGIKNIDLSKRLGYYGSLSKLPNQRKKEISEELKVKQDQIAAFAESLINNGVPEDKAFEAARRKWRRMFQ